MRAPRSIVRQRSSFWGSSGGTSRSGDVNICFRQRFESLTFRDCQMYKFEEMLSSSEDDVCRSDDERRAISGKSTAIRIQGPTIGQPNRYWLLFLAFVFSNWTNTYHSIYNGNLSLWRESRISLQEWSGAYPRSKRWAMNSGHMNLNSRYGESGGLPPHRTSLRVDCASRQQRQ